MRSDLRSAVPATVGANARTLESLFPELLGRIFAKICARERCRTIPFLSKALNIVHNDHLPQPDCWWIPSDEIISDSRLSWLAKTASSLRSLFVHYDDEGVEPDTSHLPQLLKIVAHASPKLQRVELGCMDCCDVALVMEALSLLANVKELKLGQWNLEGAEQLAGLKSLQGLQLQLDLVFDEAAAETFWVTLATLTELSSLQMYYLYEPREDFYNALSLVTGLRHLTLSGGGESCLNDDGEFNSSFAALRQLRSLDMSAPWCGLRSFPGLPLLQALSVHVIMDSDLSLPAFTSTALLGLTSLSLTTENEAPLKLEALFFDSMTALHGLRELQLTRDQLKDFPASVAASLKCLTFLNLCINSFESFPAAVSQISTLRSLWLDRNKIELVPGDLTTLGAMPALQFLSMVDRGCWSAESATVLMDIRESLPKLVVELLDFHRWSKIKFT